MSDLRHSRTNLLAGVGAQGMENLHRTHVVVVGCGGVGQAVAGILGTTGLGQITLIDAETVSPTNLGRLPLMQAGDVGRPKVEALADALRKNNPAQIVQPVHQVVSAKTIGEICGQAHIVIDATDNWPTRKMLSGYCRDRGIPLVSGGALATDGWVGVFLPDGPPLEAWLGQPQQLADSCERVGVLGPLVGIVGNWMAMEVLKLVWQANQPKQWAAMTGRILYIDGRYGDVRMQPLD